jgi:membrane fusion protein (multidrug efflux system)
MSIRRWVSSVLIVAAVVGVGASLAAWKRSSIQESDAASANQPEPMESITVASATERENRRTTTSIGTVIALRSITLRNELSGTVREVRLTPGQIVEEGTLLVALDVSVEEAELKAQRAQAALAESQLDRLQRAVQSRATSELEVDRARSERDVALAQIARTQAVIARKTIRAPFRARAGMSDVHPGQYLNEGTPLTTLQGVDDASHVDFAVAQQVAAGLKVDDGVEVWAAGATSPVAAKIVAIDSRIDRATRNALVRARIEGNGHAPSPGASVRVRVPVGPATRAVAVPVSALRKGPGGDHVFVIAAGKDGKPRAHVRPVESGAVLGDEVLIHAGLVAGDQVAASGSFKLREAVLVAIANGSAPDGNESK